MEETFVNKVAESGIITLNLEDYYPKEAVASFDLKDYLFMGLILKEKDYREALKAKDFSEYQGKNVALFCSADAIIPIWAYMLATNYLQPIAKSVVFETPEKINNQLLLNNINGIDASDFADARVVVKGCGELPIGEAAYVAITAKLRPYVKSIMYGEPCSTVPVYKKQK